MVSILPVIHIFSQCTSSRSTMEGVYPPKVYVAMCLLATGITTCMCLGASCVSPGAYLLIALQVACVLVLHV